MQENKKKKKHIHKQSKKEAYEYEQSVLKADEGHGPISIERETKKLVWAFRASLLIRCSHYREQKKKQPVCVKLNFFSPAQKLNRLPRTPVVLM